MYGSGGVIRRIQKEQKKRRIKSKIEVFSSYDSIHDVITIR